MKDFLMQPSRFQKHSSCREKIHVAPAKEYRQCFNTSISHQAPYIFTHSLQSGCNYKSWL